MSDECISPLRRRMIEDMTVRKFTLKTQNNYIRVVKSFTIFLGRSPDTASNEDLYQPAERLTQRGFPNRERRDSTWQTEGVCHGPSNSGADGLFGRRGSPVCKAREGCRAGAEAVSDCGGTRWELAGRRGEDRRDGSPDAAGLGDPVQRARAGWSHQHPFAWRATQARRQAQGLSRPDREGGSDPCGPRRGSLACVRSDHAALRGVCALGVGRHHLSRPEGLGLLARERPAESLQAGR